MRIDHRLRNSNILDGIILPVLLLFLITSPAAGQKNEGVRKHFAFPDLQRLQSVTDAVISPDGGHVAYTVAADNVLADTIADSLWVLNLSDQHARPRQLHNASEPAWSPSGAELATVQTEAAGQCAIAIWSNGSFQKLHSFSTPCSPSRLAWSPDGKQLVFTLFVAEEGDSSFLDKAIVSAETTLTRPDDAHRAPAVEVTQIAHYRQDGGQLLKPGHRHLFVLSGENGRLQQIGAEPFDDDEPAWTPDGTHLLFTSDRRRESSRSVQLPAVYITDLVGHAVRLTEGPTSCNHPVMSPDGRHIAYTAIPNRKANYTRSDLYVMDADGSQPQHLGADLDRDIYPPVWSADSRSLIARYDDHGIGYLERFRTNGTRERLLSGVGSRFSVATSGTIAYLAKSSVAPDDLAVSERGQTRTNLTGINGFLQARELAQPLHLLAHSAADGREVEAWVLLPTHAPPQTRFPTIFAMHGGPFGSDGPDWSSTYQLFAAAGYAVVYANYRGSTSYGSAFSEPANKDFPGLAYADMMSVADEAVRQGVAAPERLFLYGGSAGGQLTTWITGKTTRFRAAVAEKPVVNVLSNALVTDQYLGALYFAGGEPWNLEQALWRQSPLSLAGAIKTPTLFVVGEKDYRTPLDETLQLYDALQLQGIPTALMRVPGAGHESLGRRPSQRVAELAAELAWFRRYDSVPQH